MAKRFILGFSKYSALIIILLIIGIPLVWIISIGFRTQNEVLDILPTQFTTINYPNAINELNSWGGLSFVRMFGNSFLVTTASLIGILIVSSLVAFAFSNYSFKFKEPLFIVFLLGMLIPAQVLLIPVFFLMKNLNLLGTYFTLILPYIAFNFPLGVLILRSFFEKIPLEIKEAAKIDGASDFRVFLRIILPLSRPALATLTIFSFMAVWNEFLFALVFIRNDSMQTIPLILSRMGISRYGVDYGVYGAFITMTIIPMLIIFLIFQRWFIAGLSAGAVKG